MQVAVSFDDINFDIHIQNTHLKRNFQHPHIRRISVLSTNQNKKNQLSKPLTYLTNSNTYTQPTNQPTIKHHLL